MSHLYGVTPRRRVPSGREAFCPPTFEALEQRLLLDGSSPVESYPLLPLLFVENQGQWAEETVRYVHSGDGLNVGVTDAGLVFQGFRSEPGEESTWAEVLQFSAAFTGANAVVPVGLARSATVFNFLTGTSSDWHTDVPAYETVAYQGLYEGIDLHIRGLSSHLKYEFHVAPGADASQLAIRYEGVAGLSIGDDGELRIDLGEGWGQIVDDAPVIYQVVGGERLEVAGQYRLLGPNTYTIEVTGTYDPETVLVIDPDLDWMTYLGGSEWDWGKGIADDAGNTYVAGYTESTGWATTGAYDETYNGNYDVFVAKINSTGDTLVYCTYLGGSEYEDCHGIAVDDSGNVYVTGETKSTGWATSGAYDETHNGGYDIFVAKMNAAGNGLLYATYLGGGNWDWSRAIALDTSGNAYITGYTESSGWATSGAYDTSHNGAGDIFVAKVNSTGDTLSYCTYLGGSDLDWGDGIALDASANAYVTGYTKSAGWATSGAYDETHNGSTDVFVAKVNATGSSLLYATYLGGTDHDEAHDISVDGSDNAYVTGRTESSGWATTGAYDETHNGGYDIFVARVSAAGDDLDYATYLGGTGGDEGYGIVLDASANAFVTGHTQSSGWATSGAYDETHNGGYDVFVAKVNPTGASLLYASYLGGSGGESGEGISVDSAGVVYVTGWTTSSGWATTGAYDTTYNGDYDVFVAKIDVTPPALVGVELNGYSDREVSQAVGGVHGITAIELTFSEAVNLSASNILVQEVTFPGGVETLGATVTPSGVTGSGTSVVTVSFASDAIVDTWVKVTLYGTGGTPVTDLAGNALDGEPNAGGSGRGYIYSASTDLPSGDGTIGGDAVFFVGSLVSDASGDGKVGFADAFRLNQAWGSQTGDPNFDPKADFSGDGRVGFSDAYQLNVHWGQRLDTLPTTLGAVGFSGYMATTAGVRLLSCDSTQEALLSPVTALTDVSDASLSIQGNLSTETVEYLVTPVARDEIVQEESVPVFVTGSAALAAEPVAFAVLITVEEPAGEGGTVPTTPAGGYRQPLLSLEMMPGVEQLGLLAVTELQRTLSN